MCLICIEFDRQKLTFEEAERNAGEGVPNTTEEHLAAVRHVLKRRKQHGPMRTVQGDEVPMEREVAVEELSLLGQEYQRG